MFTEQVQNSVLIRTVVTLLSEGVPLQQLGMAWSFRLVMLNQILLTAPPGGVLSSGLTRTQLG